MRSRRSIKMGTKHTYDLLARDYYQMRTETGKNHKSQSSKFYNEYLEMPTTLKMLGKVKGKRILDLGCGPGLYAKKLLAKGAKVKGIDFSQEMIRIAEHIAPQGAFHVGNARKLPYKNGEFDLVLSSLMMDHLDSWNAVLREVKRVLKKGGVFVFSGYNPVMHFWKNEKWLGRKFSVVRGYNKEGPWKTVWKGFEGRQGESVHYRKRYGTIVRALVQAGFEIVDYEDALPAPASKKLFPKLYQKFRDAPRFCVWRVKRK